jgi:hypothetical protein
MIDLSKSTFIIPLRIESEDRMRNIITLLCFLLGNFNTKIVVKEVDNNPVFEHKVIPQIKEFLGKEEISLLHIFEHSDDPVFYRMQILNEMISLCDTEIVVNYDCDVLLPLKSYVSSYNMILNEGYDLVYPYGNGTYQKQILANDALVSDFLNQNYDFNILDSKSNISTSDFGWVQFFNRLSYIEGGMENENFRGSSPEDKERFYRFKTLGYNVGRVDNLIYHLEHSRGRNSWPASIQGNPYMKQNFELWETLQKMSSNQLKEYYSYQSYLKKYVGI